MTLHTNFYAVPFILLTLFLQVGCTTAPTFPVKAELSGEKINTTVDSMMAKYYLENYLQANKTNPDRDKEIDVLYAQQAKATPSREELKIISREYSVDFAALFFAQSLLANENNKVIQNLFNHFLNNENTTPTFGDSSKQYLVLFVPGWDYVDTGRFTGSDFAEPRKLITQLNIENYLVEIPPHGSVQENADFLSIELEKHNLSGKKIIIAGASSAGPAIHLSLAEQKKRSQQNNIKAWINLGGILKGSPLIDHYQTWPKRWLFNSAAWYMGWDKEKILSMSAETSRLRFARLNAIDSQMLVINYLGLSLSGQLSQHAKDKYPLLVSEGPNDGLTLLTDIIAPNSLTIVAFGNDHFFAEDPRINEKTVALMKVIIAILEKNKTGINSNLP